MFSHDEVNFISDHGFAAEIDKFGQWFANIDLEQFRPYTPIICKKDGILELYICLGSNCPIFCFRFNSICDELFEYFIPLVGQYATDRHDKNNIYWEQSLGMHYHNGLLYMLGEKYTFRKEVIEHLPKLEVAVRVMSKTN